MTKIGDTTSVQLGGKSTEAQTGQKQEQLSFARSLSRSSAAFGAVGPVSQSINSSPTHSVSPPPAYNAMQTASYEDVAMLVRSTGSDFSSALEELSAGLSNKELPNVVIITTPSPNGSSEIVSVGRNIFIPAPLFAQWQSNGAADPQSASAFNAAFSNLVARNARHNG